MVWVFHMLHIIGLVWYKLLSLSFGSNAAHKGILIRQGMQYHQKFTSDLQQPHEPGK